MERFSSGAQRFVAGLAKKLLLANNLGQLWDVFKAAPVQELSVAGAWLGITAFAFQIYFDFSGYSDMAIGLGRMFGFEFMENFNYPYISKSITEFWRRWHISLLPLSYLLMVSTETFARSARSSCFRPCFLRSSFIL